jgi:hypothetical protein
MIMTLVSLFLSLPEEKEMTEHVHAEATPGGHPEGVVDFEVMKIASENLTTSSGLEGAETISRETPDGADQAEEMEV